jgi:hypothetical protein
MRGFVGVVLIAGVISGCSPDHNPMAVQPPSDSVASYTVTFTSTWSAATHPTEFPAGAHFSGLIGATHDDRVRFWREGELASPGIQAMAELGSKSPLSDEIAAAQTAGTAQNELSGEGIRPSPGQVALDFDISVTHPLVTLVSMIAPSPDWFVGVADLSLRRNGAWVDSMSVVLYGWDAGTDVGTTYTAANAAAMPHVPITPLVDGPFNVGGAVPSLGTFTFIRRQR